MKNLFITSLFTFFFGGIIAQTQFEAMKAIGEGEYRVYDVHKQDKGYNFTYNPQGQLMTFKINNIDDIRRFEIDVKWENFNLTFSFGEDVIGYPITMQKGGLKHPDLKYSKRLKGEDRMVVVNDIIYYLSDYKSSTDFKIYKVLKKGKLNTFQKQKEVYAVLKMNKQGLDEKLMNYLKLEENKQSSEMSKWTSENPDYQTQLAKEGGEWDGKVAESNAKYAELLAKNIRVVNNTSNTIYFGTSHNVNRFKIEPGSYETIDCAIATLYKSNASGEKKEVLVKPSEYCGKTFKVSNW